MNYHEFTALIGRRARFESADVISKAVRATLETLAECLPAAEIARLATKLPREAAMYMERRGVPEQFSIHEFFERVSARSNTDKPVAVQRAWAVMSVVEQQLSLEELNGMRLSLPRQFSRLFECAV
jgi:uncharacterized protein (DUF2267 family)